jgi:hypothetical protein
MSSTYYVGSINVFMGTQGMYYIVDGIKYDAHFPVAWAMNHFSYPDLPEVMSGPKGCPNCRAYGTINAVFVGYCAGCSNHVYNFTRGGVVYNCSQTDEEQLWQQFPYMHGVRLWQIGDRSIRFVHVVSDDEEENDEDLDLDSNIDLDSDIDAEEDLQQDEQQQEQDERKQDEREQEWRDIAYDLYETKLYQQLEIDLCL